MAGTILFLASRAGAYVNGAVWLVDGGRIGTVASNYWRCKFNVQSCYLLVIFLIRQWRARDLLISSLCARRIFQW